MDPRELLNLLESVRDGGKSPAQALERLRELPFEDLGFAKIDHHRALRRGFPEAVFGSGKTPEQVAAIVGRIAARGQNVLVTRTTSEVHALVAAAHPNAEFHPAARCLTLAVREPEPLHGRVAVLCAGTSDVPVAEEAAVTAGFFGATRGALLRRRRRGPAPPARTGGRLAGGRRADRGGRHGGRAAVAWSGGSWIPP